MREKLSPEWTKLRMCRFEEKGSPGNFSGDMESRREQGEHIVFAVRFVREQREPVLAL